MAKKKKVKKVKKVRKAKKVKLAKIKTSSKILEKKSVVPGQEEKPEIKKIKKQPTEKRIYNLKILLCIQSMELVR